MLEAALDLAARGWFVFPLIPGRKEPLTRNGFKDASIDEAAIRAWWTATPDANIGIDCGRSGLAVLDVDPKNGGDETFKRLFPVGFPTLACRTGGGGQHFFFQLGEDQVVDSTAGRVGAGLDVRSRGGYVVAAPSLHPSGNNYEWDGGSDLLPWVGELARLNEKKPVAEVTRPLAPRTNVIPSGYVRAMLEGQTARVASAPEGTRNVELNSAAYRIGRFVGPALDEAEAVGQLLAATTLPEAEAVKTIRSGIAAGMKEPASIPEAPARGGLTLVASEGQAVVPKPGEPSKIQFKTLEQMRAEMAATVPQRAIYLVDGCITEIDGALKNGGKTTFVLAMIRSLLAGEPFLGVATVQSKVVYLNESPVMSFLQATDRAGLSGGENFSVLNFQETFGPTWETKIAACVEHAKKMEAKVLVVDTFSQWAGLSGDMENSAGSMLEALLPLQKAQAAGLAIIIIRHTRKSGGGVGLSARGSTVISGAVDMIVEICRQEGNENPNQRLLSYVGRFGGFPETQVAEWDPETSSYSAVGGKREAKAADVEATVLRGLGDDEWTGTDLAADLREQGKDEGKKGVRKHEVIRALDRLVKQGFVTCSGTGKKGSPKLYRRARFSVPEEREQQGTESQNSSLDFGVNL